jgi:tetratricopeptide (TPR) repeat protein
MKLQLRRFLVFNRLLNAVVLIALGFLLGFKVTWWLAWIPFLIAILSVVAHYLIGPMTLIQSYVESGDIEGARTLLARVKKPEWLYKPVRSSYYMLRGNLSTMSEDLDTAEADIKKSLEAGLPEKEYEGSAYLQLGSIASKKGNTKEAYEHFQKAVKAGLPDADSRAMAYLQLANILLQRRSYKGAKLYFGKAKACKATNDQVVSQIKEMNTYMARIPG